MRAAVADEEEGTDQRLASQIVPSQTSVESQHAPSLRSVATAALFLTSPPSPLRAYASSPARLPCCCCLACSPHTNITVFRLCVCAGEESATTELWVGTGRPFVQKRGCRCGRAMNNTAVQRLRVLQMSDQSRPWSATVNVGRAVRSVPPSRQRRRHHSRCRYYCCFCCCCDDCRHRHPLSPSRSCRR